MNALKRIFFKQPRTFEVEYIQLQKDYKNLKKDYEKLKKDYENLKYGEKNVQNESLQDVQKIEEPWEYTLLQEKIASEDLTKDKILQKGKPSEDLIEIYKWFKDNENKGFVFNGSKNEFEVKPYTDDSLKIEKKEKFFSVKVSTTVGLLTENDFLYSTIQDLYLVNEEFVDEKERISNGIKAIEDKGVEIGRLIREREFLEFHIKRCTEMDNYTRNILGEEPEFPYIPTKDKGKIAKITATLDEWNSLHDDKFSLDGKYSDKIEEVVLSAARAITISDVLSATNRKKRNKNL